MRTLGSVCGRGDQGGELVIRADAPRGARSARRAANPSKNEEEIALAHRSGRRLDVRGARLGRWCIRASMPARRSIVLPVTSMTTPRTRGTCRPGRPGSVEGGKRVRRVAPSSSLLVSDTAGHAEGNQRAKLTRPRGRCYQHWHHTARSQRRDDATAKSSEVRRKGWTDLPVHAAGDRGRGAAGYWTRSSDGYGASWAATGLPPIGTHRS